MCSIAGPEESGSRELDSVIAQLDAATKKLPRAAIQWTREHRDLAVPRLIEVIRSATASARAGKAPDGNAHFFALFLLTEFQAKEALPAIIEAVSLPGESPFDLFEDVITETLARILPVLAADPPKVLDDLIANREANEYVRWEAAQSYLLLVRDGRMSREEAVRRIGGHLRAVIDQDDVRLTSYLVHVLHSLAPREAKETIADAFARDMVDPWLVRQEDMERSISEGDPWVQRALSRGEPIGIQDTVAELETWAAFREERPVRRPRRVAKPASRATEPAKGKRSPSSQLTRDRVGRNEPCPCGSGKKYKKCCGSQR